MPALGQVRYRVRYQYKVPAGKDPVTKEQLYKTKTPTRNVDAEPGADEKQLTEILEASHHREAPVGLKVLAFEEAGTKPLAKAAPPQVDEESKAKIAELEAKVAGIEKEIADLTAAVKELAKPAPNKPAAPDDSGSGSKKSGGK